MEENGTAQGTPHTRQARASTRAGAVSPKRLCLLGRVRDFTSQHGRRDL